MKKNRKITQCISVIFSLVLVILLVVPNQVLAQDEEPQPEPAAETPAVETPVDPPVVEEPVVEEQVVEQPVVEESVVEGPVVEEPASEAAVAEAVDLLSESETVIEDNSGAAVALSSQEAAEILSVPDPMYCPAGAPFGDPTCSPSRGTMAEAIADAAGNGGTIYVESGDFSGFTLTGINGSELVIVGGTGGGTTTFNSQIFIANNLASITLRNFTATGSSTGKNTSGNNGGLFDNTPTILALGNSGTLTLDGLIINHGTDSAIYINNHAGDVVMNKVDADADAILFFGNEGTFVNNTAGSGNVEITDSTFYSEQDDGLKIKSKGSVLLDKVSANNNGEDGADIDNSYGNKNVTVLNSFFNKNQDIGLKIKSKEWVILDGVKANDNKNIGAYLETSGSKVIVHNSEFVDYNGGYSQDIGLEIKNTGGDHETSICNVLAKWNDDKQVKLTSPTGTEGSSFIYNICDFFTYNGSGNEIFVYGGDEWEEVVDTVEACPNGYTWQNHNGQNRCWRRILLWWDWKNKIEVDITESRSNLTVNFNNMAGGLWSQHFINKNECLGTDCVEACTLVYGCMEEDAFNYNSEAIVSDNSCVAKIYGCMDPDATNYNADANLDDGNCTYPSLPAPALALPALGLIPVTGGQLVQLPCDQECVTLQLPDGSWAEFCGLCGYWASLSEETEETMPYDMPAGKSMLMGMTVVLMDPDQVLLTLLPAGATLQVGFPKGGENGAGLLVDFYDTTAENWLELPAVAGETFVQAFMQEPGTTIVCK